MNYESEMPYLEQTISWKEGMKYTYSPDYYPISKKQYRDMQSAGKLAGIFLEEINPGFKFIEFRLDFVKDFRNNLWVTELQTDDRGLPAVTTARNAKGNSIADLLPGVSPSLSVALSEISGKKDFSLLIVYPESERFYYEGFYDLRRYLMAENPQSETIVAPNSRLNLVNGNAEISIPYAGLNLNASPDVIWDFTNNISSAKCIQKQITKQFLLDVWDNNKYSGELRKFIPETCPALDIVGFNKREYILKPINGKWSRGVVLGQYASEFDWKGYLLNPDLVAQKYISSPSENITIRTKTGDLIPQPFYSRVEGYYVKVGGKWVLADILATCTPSIPVHGMRECIMIPAQIKENYE